MLLRRFPGGEVKPRGVEAEGSQDVDLASHLPLPLGLRRTLRGYLEEALGEEEKEGEGNKERQVEEKEARGVGRVEKLGGKNVREEKGKET